MFTLPPPQPVSFIFIWQENLFLKCRWSYKTRHEAKDLLKLTRYCIGRYLAMLGMTDF